MGFDGMSARELVFCRLPDKRSFDAVMPYDGFFLMEYVLAAIINLSESKRNFDAKH